MKNKELGSETVQKIRAEIIITIPEDMVLISKVEYEDLKENELLGVYWNMKDLEKRINKKSEWIKENILYPQRFKSQLDIRNGGCLLPGIKGTTLVFPGYKNGCISRKELCKNF